MAKKYKVIADKLYVRDKDTGNEKSIIVKGDIFEGVKRGKKIVNDDNLETVVAEFVEECKDEE